MPGRCAALISTLKPWVHLGVKDNAPDKMLYNALPPELALRSVPGIMSGEPTAVLKAAAFELMIEDNSVHELLSLTLLRSAIAGLEANEGSRLALNTVLSGLQVRLL